MIDYTKLPGLAEVHLEDSYVLEVQQDAGRIIFRLEAVLTPESAAYHPPSPGEQYCYARARLVFSDVTHVDWIEKSPMRYRDATGQHDLGNIDVLNADGHVFTVQGDWGHVRICGAQPYVALEQDPCRPSTEGG